MTSFSLFSVCFFRYALYKPLKIFGAGVADPLCDLINFQAGGLRKAVCHLNPFICHIIGVTFSRNSFKSFG